MIVSFINAVIGYFTVLIYGSTGELLTEKSGNLNLGTPGIMCVGGSFSVLCGYFLRDMAAKGTIRLNAFTAIFLTLLATLIGSLLVTLIYAFLTISLKANQNVTGLAVTTFGTGLSNFIGAWVNSKAESGIMAFPEIADYYKVTLPFANKLGFFGDAFLASGFMTYLSLVIVFVLAFVIRKTRTGLNLRSVGENPATADSAGINVTKYRYLATCIGGMISGLGGLYFLMQYSDGGWNKNAILPFGWLSVAIVIFVVWKPVLGIIGSATFGALYALSNSITTIPPLTQQLFKLFPYIVTVLVLTISSMRKKRELQPPESLGLPYFREER
ncbi:MAG: ABC transporter permease [Ruminococcaceae bacterium]|nr:ABC transporter permease [Oscillospiraceae bacterium]